MYCFKGGFGARGLRFGQQASRMKVQPGHQALGKARVQGFAQFTSAWEFLGKRFRVWVLVFKVFLV